MQNGVGYAVFCDPCIRQKKKLNVIFLGVPEMRQMSKSGTLPECHMSLELVPRLFDRPFIQKKVAQSYKKMPEANVSKVGHGH